jgi:hypothetical protein
VRLPFRHTGNLYFVGKYIDSDSVGLTCASICARVMA